jgi:hypothetical protein
VTSGNVGEDRLREARAEADHWRQLFTVLVATTAGVSSPDHGLAIARIPFSHLLAGDLVLVSWPVIEFTYDFSVYRKGTEPEVPSPEQAARDGWARVFGDSATVRHLLTDPTGDEG